MTIDTGVRHVTRAGANVEAAVNGHADALISFNLRDFGDAPARFGIVLATPGQFLRSLDP